mgnify:CR=1 FL=1
MAINAKEAKILLEIAKEIDRSHSEYTLKEINAMYHSKKRREEYEKNYIEPIRAKKKDLDVLFQELKVLH